MSHRTLEFTLGILALLSVVSVPVRNSGPAPRVSPPMPRVNLDQLERVRRDALTQHQEILKLTRDTRALADLVSRPANQAQLLSPTAQIRGRDAGTVGATPDVRGSETENEEHDGCSQ